MTDTHGKPGWIDLTSHDINNAKKFYSELFGWEFEDLGEEHAHYNLVYKDGELVGGAMSSMMSMDGPTEEPQFPTTWDVYLGVDDVQEAAKAVEVNGGTIVMPPMEMPGNSSMAFATDPAGAPVGLWQSTDSRISSTTTTPGLPCWFETISNDYDAAKPFYEKVFGWMPTYTDEKGEQTTEEPTEGLRYATNFPGEEVSAGLCDDSRVNQSHWRVYFLSADVEATIGRAKELGGSVVNGPEESPFGRLYTLADPQGAQFQIIS